MPDQRIDHARVDKRHIPQHHHHGCGFSIKVIKPGFHGRTLPLPIIGVEDIPAIQAFKRGSDLISLMPEADRHLIKIACQHGCGNAADNRLPPQISKQLVILPMAAR